MESSEPATIARARSGSSTSNLPCAAADSISRRDRGARPPAAANAAASELSRTRLNCGSRRNRRPDSLNDWVNFSTGSSNPTVSESR